MTLPERFGNTARLAIAPDLRQSDTALEIQRGVLRLLMSHAQACVTELPLPNGRRADVLALSAANDIAIIEIKSCLNDFRTDSKWPEYREFCDSLYFAVRPDFPIDVLPLDAGLILADRYGGEIVRTVPGTRLSPSRRKAMTLRLARFAAIRLACAADPNLAVEAARIID